MGLSDWLGRCFGGRPKVPDEIPDVVGHMIDDNGRMQAVHRGPLQHDSLSPDHLRRVGRLRNVLIDAYPMTLDGWVDGFMRDVNPEAEIRFIEACAVVYQRLTHRVELALGEKQLLYAVLCAISTGRHDPELEFALPKSKGLPRLAVMIAMYEEARRLGLRP